MARIPKDSLAKKIISTFIEEEIKIITVQDIVDRWHVSRDNANKAIKVLVQEYSFTTDDMKQFYPKEDLSTYDPNAKEMDISVKVNDMNVNGIDTNVKEIDTNVNETEKPKEYIKKTLNPFAQSEDDKYIYITKEKITDIINKYLYHSKKADYSAPITLARTLGMTTRELQNFIAYVSDKHPDIGKLFEMFNDKYIQTLVDKGKLGVQSPQAKDKLGIKNQGEVVPMSITLYKNIKEDDND